MNVLIIPEDYRKDQYLLRPLFSRLVKSFDRRSIHIRICSDPLLGGIGEALKSERIREICGKYEGMIDVFILCVDRDGHLGRRQRLDQLESEFGIDVPFLAENAWEEIETWVLAGLQLPRKWSWADVRLEIQVKERYFEPLAAERYMSDSPDGGRGAMGREAARRIGRIRQICREDFDVLATRLEEITRAR